MKHEYARVSTRFFNLTISMVGLAAFFKQGGRVSFEKGLSKDPVDKQSKEVVFAGDSHISNFDWEDYFKGLSVANRGIGGDTSGGLLQRIEQVTELNPEKVFLLVGINDIAQGVSLESIEYSYIQIIDVIKKNKPNTHIYAQSVFPVAGELYESYFSKQSGPINESVARLNKRISQLAGATFIDVADKFGTELATEYSVDGLHLNKEGYEVWLNKIEEYVVE